MLVGGYSFLALLAFLAWLEGGEIGVLVHADPSRPQVETRLWVVDVNGATYVRAPTADTIWLDRLLAGHVRLRRGETTVLVRAVPVDDPWTRRAVNEAMQRKYGVFDRFFGQLHGGAASLPIRLEPITANVFSH
jgi:hypothetical protein